MYLDFFVAFILLCWIYSKLVCPNNGVNCTVTSDRGPNPAKSIRYCSQKWPVWATTPSQLLSDPHFVTSWSLLYLTNIMVTPKQYECCSFPHTTTQALCILSPTCSDMKACAVIYWQESTQQYVEVFIHYFLLALSMAVVLLLTVKKIPKYSAKVLKCTIVHRQWS